MFVRDKNETNVLSVNAFPPCQIISYIPIHAIVELICILALPFSDIFFVFGAIAFSRTKYRT